MNRRLVRPGSRCHIASVKYRQNLPLDSHDTTSRKTASGRYSVLEPWWVVKATWTRSLSVRDRFNGWITFGWYCRGQVSKIEATSELGDKDAEEAANEVSSAD